MPRTTLFLLFALLACFGERWTREEYDDILDTVDAHPKAHTYDGKGKLGEMTLYEIQDFAETIDDPDEREKVEKFASSMEMMLKMLKKNPAVTTMNDLRKIAAGTRRRKAEEAAAQHQEPLGDELEDELAKFMSGAGLGADPTKATMNMMAQMEPFMKALGINPDDIDENQLQEMMQPEKLHEMSQKMLKQLGLGADGLGAGGGLLDSLLNSGMLSDEKEFDFDSWISRLSEKDQLAFRAFLQNETPTSLEELQEITKEEMAQVMSPLQANRIWRHIHLKGKDHMKRKRGGLLGGLTDELADVMEQVEKNPKMKQYSERFMESLLQGGEGSHKDILQLTKEMQDDPAIKELTEKLKTKGPQGPFKGFESLMSGFKGLDMPDTDFKMLLEQMSELGLPGFDKDMLARLDGVDIQTVKDEYGQMMEALMTGKDLASLELPTIDALMGRMRDDL